MQSRIFSRNKNRRFESPFPTVRLSTPYLDKLVSIIPAAVFQDTPRPRANRFRLEVVRHLEYPAKRSRRSPRSLFSVRDTGYNNHNTRVHSSDRNSARSTRS